MVRFFKFDTYRTCIVDVRVRFPNGSYILGAGAKATYDKHYTDIQFYNDASTEATGGTIPEKGTPDYDYAVRMFDAQAEYEAVLFEANAALNEAKEKAAAAFTAALKKPKNVTVAKSDDNADGPDDILQLVDVDAT